MRTLNAVKVSLPVILIFGLVMANCIGEPEMLIRGPDGPGWTDGVDTPIACDPDNSLGCNDNFFVCYENELGEKECYGQNPDVPGGGSWECVQDGTTLTCTGAGPNPGDGNGWICEDVTQADGTVLVVCQSHAPIPEDGGDTAWDCYYNDQEYRVCEATDGGGGDGDGDTDTDGDGDTDTDGDGDTDTDGDGDTDTDGDGDVDLTDCECIPGAWRYCDTPRYCNWGTQTCRDDGLDWGTCEELGTIPMECMGIDGWYSPAAEACCVDQAFCCQDMWDLDHDGDTWESLGNCVDIVCE